MFTPENRSFTPIIRSWEREILPAFREGYRMVILHWVMDRRHYEPVIPRIDDPGTPHTEVIWDTQRNKRRMGEHFERGTVSERLVKVGKHVKGQQFMDTFTSMARKKQHSSDPG